MLVIVFVVDGLRPDSITREATPTLFRLRAEGVSFASSHAVFPTVTRVNAAALSTGTQPGSNGLLGNQLYVPAIDRGRALARGHPRALPPAAPPSAPARVRGRRLDRGNRRGRLDPERVRGGRLLLAPTLAERLHGLG